MQPLFPPPALSSLSQRQPGCRDAPSRAGRSAAGADQAPSSSWPETSPLSSAGSASSGPASVPRSLPGWETRDRREKLLSRPRTGPGGGEGGDRGQSRVVGGSVLGRQRMADAGSGRVGRLKKSLIIDTFQREEENGRRSTVGLIRRESADVLLQ